MNDYNTRIEELNKERLSINVGIRTEKEKERYYKIVGKIEQLNELRTEKIVRVKELQIEFNKKWKQRNNCKNMGDDALTNIKAVIDFITKEWNLKESEINGK